VNAFYAAALKEGGVSDGEPDVRLHYHEGYYAAFIRDPDGNRIEAVRFCKRKLDHYSADRILQCVVSHVAVGPTLASGLKEIRVEHRQ
jgi:hypothetical protein